MKYPNIIGREVEISTLERLYKSKKSEFVAIYGRRRIGKSYLVSEVYGSKIVFSAVGTYVKDGDKNYETYRKLQLDHFYDSLVLSGLDATTVERPTCWHEAFLLLAAYGAYSILIFVVGYCGLLARVVRVGAFADNQTVAPF